MYFIFGRITKQRTCKKKSEKIGISYIYIIYMVIIIITKCREYIKYYKIQGKSCQITCSFIQEENKYYFHTKLGQSMYFGEDKYQNPSSPPIPKPLNG